nr:hypothetical protein [Serratia marcescens]
MAKSLGKPDEVFDKADKVIEAEYTFLRRSRRRWSRWTAICSGTAKASRRATAANQTLDHKQLCDLFELPPEKVQIETILAGGSRPAYRSGQPDAGAGSGGRHGGGRQGHRPWPRREGGMDARGRHPQRLVSPDDPAPPARRHSRRQGGGLDRYRGRL